ncbi:MAG TPA: hypothetical protein VIX73_14185 [Kofleriaceae bacterium]
MRVRAMLGFLAAVPACGHSPPVAQPSAGELACELKLRDTGSRIGLGFVLANRSSSPATVHYLHPFLQFDLRVTAGDRALTVVQPDVDVPAQLRELAIAAGGTAELATPVSLRFASDAPATAASMVWTIDSAPTTVDVKATLRFEGESLPPCATRIERR